MKAISTLAAWLVFATACNFFGAPSVPAFYNPPSPLPPGKPGEIIKSEVMTDAPAGTKAWRILYHSTDLEGNDVAVSGALFAPDQPAPEHGFPILAQAHGTTGVARGCAPSLQPFHALPGRQSFYETYIAPFLAAGDAVVLPDYQGMGAPGNASYLVGNLEGKNVLDGIRALKNFSEIKTAPQTFVWGHSQGGHAAAFASQLQSSYAPDIPLTGVVLLAPAVELKALVEHIFAEPSAAPTTGLMLMVAYAWSQNYPELKNQPLVKANADFTPVETECAIGAILSTLKPPGDYFAADPLSQPDWARRIQENMPDPSRLKIPMMIAQGKKDTIVFPPTTDAFVKALCGQGLPIYSVTYDNEGHLDLAKAASGETLKYMEKLGAGEPPPSIC